MNVSVNAVCNRCNAALGGKHGTVKFNSVLFAPLLAFRYRKNPEAAPADLEFLIDPKLITHQNVGEIVLAITSYITMQQESQ